MTNEELVEQIQNGVNVQENMGLKCYNKVVTEVANKI